MILPANKKLSEPFYGGDQSLEILVNKPERAAQAVGVFGGNATHYIGNEDYCFGFLRLGKWLEANKISKEVDLSEAAFLDALAHLVGNAIRGGYTAAYIESVATGSEVNVALKKNNGDESRTALIHASLYK